MKLRPHVTCQRLGACFLPFFALAPRMFVPLTWCATHMCYALPIASCTTRNVKNIARWSSVKLPLWGGQIRFWTTTIAFSLCKQVWIPLKYILSTDSAYFGASPASTSLLIFVFWRISLPHSHPSSSAFRLICTISLVGYRPHVHPCNHFRCGWTVGKLSRFLHFISTLKTPYIFSPFLLRSGVYSGWWRARTCIVYPMYIS